MVFKFTASSIDLKTGLDNESSMTKVHTMWSDFIRLETH